MLIEKYRRLEVDDVVLDNVKKEITFKVVFKHLITYYTILQKDLFFIDEEYIKLFLDGTHRLYVILDVDNQYVQLDISKRIVKKGLAIDKFKVKEFDPIEYINYYQYNIFTQLDGITTIVGMSGAGKTFSALSMLGIFSQKFTKIAYLNYELPERDIYMRMKEMYSDKRAINNIVEKLYMKDGIMSSLDLEEILMAMDVRIEDKVVFIIDNVGSVRGQEDNVYQKQNEFLKQLDVICKERGFHALALTQTVKDHNLSIFDDNGDIKGSINMSIMSGSIELGNFSRTVLFTGYNGKTQQFKNKFLKKGTGLLYSVKGVDSDADFIKL